MEEITSNFKVMKKKKTLPIFAEKVGVNLRTLQQYEIRAKDINRAAGSTLFSLAKVLGCRVEDLLEYDSNEIEGEES